MYTPDSCILNYVIDTIINWDRFAKNNLEFVHQLQTNYRLID